jgi:hypothetical protein
MLRPDGQTSGYACPTTSAVQLDVRNVTVAAVLGIELAHSAYAHFGPSVS